ncbi:hypothetical protein BLNAU_7793 [Blattamonas nauphoetae]|uniref:Uncharacterized protein n=1 Tax=Blattamonas nauphoetae TaxID=2049346 RepID=A0ABQ9Y0H9_9EUKA|nr:hypothetical protein BLNAU_7793 [Blattamonas nauphoetae]
MPPKKKPLPPLRSIPKTRLLEKPTSPPPVSSDILPPTSSRKSISQHAPSTSSLPNLPLPSDFPTDERVMDISKQTKPARRVVSKQKASPKKTLDTTALHQTIQALELEVKRLQEELSQRPPKDLAQLHRSTQTPVMKRPRPSPSSLAASPKKQLGESVGYDITDVYSVRASLGTFLGVDERCVRMCQNNREIATDPLSNRLFSSLERSPVEISLNSRYINVEIIPLDTVSRYINLERFETLGTLKKKAAEIYDTDVRCITFVRLLEPYAYWNRRTDLDPKPPVSPATVERMKSIALSDDVELDQLTTDHRLDLLTDISPLVLEVTLRTNNNSTAKEMNRFEKMEALLAPAAALFGKGKDEVTLWCCGVRVNPLLALDSLSAHFSLPPQLVLAQQDENYDPRQNSCAFWLPEAPVRITLDVMGRDYGVRVVVVCGDVKNEFVRVSSRTSGLELKKMVGDWQQVDWRRVRLWKDEQNEEGGTTETGQMNKKKEGTREGGSLTQRSKRTRQFMSEAGRVRNMTRTLSLTLHCRVAPASMRIVARTETTTHSLKVESWERIGRVRKEIGGVMGREGAELSLFLGEKELRDWDVVSGLTDESEMEISVVEWPGMVLVEVRVDGKEEEHSMCASATLRSLSRRVMLSNRHLSPSSLTFTHNDTPLPLSTRLISLGLSPSLVATLQPAPAQPRKAPITLSSRIKTTICGFRMDVDTVTKDSRIPLKKFRETVDFTHVNLINIKTGSLLPFTLIPDEWKPKIELSTPLTYSDLVACTLNLRYELKPEFVDVQLKLEGHSIDIVHTSVLRKSPPSLVALRNDLERQVVLEIKMFLGAETFANRQDQQDERSHTADLWRAFERQFSLPPLLYQHTELTENTFSSLIHHTDITLTCSVPSDTVFVVISHMLTTHTFVVPSRLSTLALFSSLKCHCPFLAEPSNNQLVPFVNGRLINSFSSHTIGTLSNSPILNVTFRNPHEKMLVNVISPMGRKRQVSLPLNQLRYFMSTHSHFGDLIPQHCINFFTLFEDESHLIRIKNSLDTQFGYDGSVPTIRVVLNPAVDIRFFDAEGDLRSVYFDRQRHSYVTQTNVLMKRTIQRAVESRIILRFVDGQEEDSEADGVDDEWTDKSDIGSDEENRTENDDEDAHNEEETEEGDRDSYDPDVDLKSEYSLDSIGSIGRLLREQASNSDTDNAFSSVQPLFTTVSLDLVKVRTICRLFGEMDATVECIMPFVRSRFIPIRESFARTLIRRLAHFLSLPDYLLDVHMKKMRKTGETQFESTVVESVEVVADVEVRSEIVEVSVTVVSGLMECGAMEGTLKEDHFSFSLPLSSSFLSLERLLREQLPQLGNVCWFTEPTNPSDEIEDRLDFDLYIWCELGGSMTDYDTAILNPNMPIFAGEVFPSLPIRLTAVESLLPDSPTRLVSIDGTRKTFVSWTHAISPLVLLWPPTVEFMQGCSKNPDELGPPPPFPPHSLLPAQLILTPPAFTLKDNDDSDDGDGDDPTLASLDASKVYKATRFTRRSYIPWDEYLTEEIFDSCMADLTSYLSPNTTSPNSRPDESTTPLRLWIETPMRRVMGLFGGSATVHDVLFFVGSLHCVCAPLSFHKHALFVGDEKLDGLVTVSEILRTFGSVVSFRIPHVD